jgi:hypothetical protein
MALEIWYLMDVQGAVVGPLPQASAVSLLRSRPGMFTKASNDGSTWRLLTQQVQLESAVAQESAPQRVMREEQEAQRVLFDLDRFRDLAPHELFSVPQGSTKREFRQGFLNVAKRYHPGRLARDVAPALLKAHIAVYQFLSEVIAKAEKTAPDDVAAAPPPVVSPSGLYRSTTTPQPSSPSGLYRGSATPQPSSPSGLYRGATTPRPSSPSGISGQPVWRLEQLNLKKDHHRLLASIDVTEATAFVFSAHRLMNLKSSGGVFFPCMPTLAMGTKLELNFHFKEANQVVSSRGAVVFESLFSDAKQMRGFGVQLESLKPEVKGFMLREVDRLSRRV